MAVTTNAFEMAQRQFDQVCRSTEVGPPGK